MRSTSHRSPTLVLAALLALGTFGAMSGCNADLETICYGQPSCEGTGAGPGDTTSAGGAGGGEACPADSATGDIPCDVHAIIDAKCNNCHNEDHVGGATIDLLACDRFHELDCAKKQARTETARQYVETGFMPLGSMKLTEDEKTLLLEWLGSCAPCEAAGSGCGDPPGAKVCGG